MHNPLPLLLPTLSLLLHQSHAHMEMTQPYAIRSKYDPSNKNIPNPQIDYSMTSPLLASGSDFACKGYQNDRPIRTAASYPAGSQQTLALAGSATHDGGSCQISLSYDNGRTFRVIKSMIGGCPLQKSYNFTVPGYAPRGTALLAWSWQNLVGNREFYMNCAWVEVTVGAPATGRTEYGRVRRRNAHRHRRHARRASIAPRYSSWTDLPFIWKANLPPVSPCVTSESQVPVYPHPGPDVEYSSGASAASPSNPGDCDEPTPDPPTYKPLSTDGATAEGVSYPPPGNSASPDSEGGSTSSSSSSSAAASYNNGQYTPPPQQPLPQSQPQPLQQQPPQSPASSAALTPQGPYANSSDFGAHLPCEPGNMLCTSATAWAECADPSRYLAMGATAAGMVCVPREGGRSGVMEALPVGGS